MTSTSQATLAHKLATEPYAPTPTRPILLRTVPIRTDPRDYLYSFDVDELEALSDDEREEILADIESVPGSDAILRRAEQL